MKLFIAVRLRSVYHGKAGFEFRGASVIDYHIEKRELALKNIHQALVPQKLAIDIDGCQVYWFLIDSQDEQKDKDYFLRFNEVELCIPVADFEVTKNAIRGLKGVAYLNACEDYAAQLRVKDQQRAIQYDIQKAKQVA